VPKVVLARPDDLHRRARRPGDFDRLEHVVGVEAAPESAAEQRDLERDRIEGNAEQLRHTLLRLVRRLRADPDLTPPVAHVGHAVERLHRGVPLERHRVRRFHPARRLRERPADVSSLAS
jgi:hypothetical protein